MSYCLLLLYSMVYLKILQINKNMMMIALHEIECDIKESTLKGISIKYLSDL